MGGLILKLDLVLLYLFFIYLNMVQQELSFSTLTILDLFETTTGCNVALK